MLKKLQLTNFRRHRDLAVSFGAGMQVIRAANEGGKTTIIEALLYALFGSRSLRTSVDDAVTWGENARTLKVEATLEVVGEVLTFIRSKAGAEVLKDGQVYVSGQTEVTNFASKLIGADAATASNLMLASQANMRGALEQGPKATSELVEGLAEFDFFDHLLERMQERLVLGSDASARMRLEDAQSRLESLSAEKPDTTQWEEVVANSPRVIAHLQGHIESELKPVYETTRQALDKAKNSRSTYDLLQNNLNKVRGSLEDAQTQYIAAERRSAEVVDTGKIKTLEAQLGDALDQEKQRDVYGKLLNLNSTYPETHWRGDAQSLQAEVDGVEAEIETLNLQLADNKQQTASLSSEITTLERQMQRDDHCSACGQLLQNHEEIAKRNAKIAKQLADLHIRVIRLGPIHDQLQEQLAERKSDLADLKAVAGLSTPFDAFIRNHAQYVVVDSDFVPPRILWGGPVPQGDVDVTDIQRQIKEIETADKNVKEARAKCSALADTIAAYEGQVKEFTEQLNSFDVVNLAEFQEANNVAYRALSQAEQQIERFKEETREAQTQIQLAAQSYEQQQARITEAEEQVAACRSEIDDLGFNNALLKKVRASRGPVTDKLWNMVLAATSTMFSTMRGEDSVVTKGKDGFLVNGETVASLSGSTLDLLGLAIRVALTKTFLPNVSMLILDEPAAAMSDERTDLMLGFLQTAGFTQTILITHEEVSAAISDNLITL